MFPDKDKINAELSGPDFEDVHTRGVLRRLLSTLTGRARETRLLSYDEVRRKIRCHDESYSGMRSVPVDAIVGSVGRYNDFDREFLPLRRQSRERWRRINSAYYSDTPLPAVHLYKMGDADEAVDDFARRRAGQSILDRIRRRLARLLWRCNEPTQGDQQQ